MKKLLILFLFWLGAVNSCFPGVSVIGELTREKTLLPGETFEGTIDLKNTGEKTCEVSVYQTDYLFYADGSNRYGEPGSDVRSNASWLSISPHRLTIPPNEMGSVHYRVRVPESKQLASVDDIGTQETGSLNGTYWSMIMIEPVPETDPENVEGETGKVKMGIQTNIRYGIQMVTNIGESGARQIKFLNKKLTSQDGRKILEIDVENSGERWLSPTLWVEVYDHDGIKVGRFESERKRIYPRCSVRHRVDLTGMPEGRYKALVVVDNGDDYVFGAKYDLGIQ
ncbi:MAG: hypothetical protein WCE90_09685 [Candidatus Zixiibacteriota bacterium]